MIVSPKLYEKHNRCEKVPRYRDSITPSYVPGRLNDVAGSFDRLQGSLDYSTDNGAFFSSNRVAFSKQVGESC